MSKLPNIGTSIFTTMSQLATEYKAINLSQGFPNFPVNKNLTDIVAKISQQDTHQYTPMAGHWPLLVKIKTLITQQYSRTINPETNLLVTAGATQGIFATIQALVSNQDQVIILDPSYDSYEPNVLLSNGIPVRVSLNDDYSPNWEAIEKVCNAQTKMIIITNPHNPTGTILSQSDITKLECVLDKYPNIILLSDEVYEYITFEEKHISIHTRPKIYNRSVIISSFGKSFHVTGWKVGYVVAPEHLMYEIKKIHQFVVFSVNSISQFAISEYIETVNTEEISSFYQLKRDYFRQLLAPTRFKLLPCQGTYFQVVSYAAISDENDVDFCKRLIAEHGVAAIPISTFYANGKDLKLIRFCFAKDNQTLEEAALRLSKL